MLYYRRLIGALTRAGYTVQDDSQPAPEGMIPAAGFGGGDHGWTVYANRGDTGAIRAIKRIMFTRAFRERG
jgi:hypothetical protein